jgi:hypothetical protein
LCAAAPVAAAPGVDDPPCSAVAGTVAVSITRAAAPTHRTSVAASWARKLAMHRLIYRLRLLWSRGTGSGDAGL